MEMSRLASLIQREIDSLLKKIGRTTSNIERRNVSVRMGRKSKVYMLKEGRGVNFTI